MKLDNWEYDFGSLPHWDDRNSYPHMYYDLLYENPRLDMAFVVYSIIEYRMGAYVGFLAILKNRKSPELVLQTREGVFGNSEIVFSMDGKLAFAKSSLWDDGWPLFIFDLLSRNFACFRTTSDNNGFTVRETARNEFTIIADKWQLKNNSSGLLEKLDGTRIEIDALKWMPFGDIDSFCAYLIKSCRKPGIFERIRAFFWG